MEPVLVGTYPYFPMVLCQHGLITPHLGIDSVKEIVYNIIPLLFTDISHMAAVHADNTSFQKEVLDHKGVVVVDFYAEWCGPCKVTAPIIEELATKMKDVKFVKVDVDPNQETASKYSIFSIPTFLIFKNGEVKNQFVGAHSKEGFVEEISKVTQG